MHRERGRGASESGSCIENGEKGGNSPFKQLVRYKLPRSGEKDTSRQEKNTGRQEKDTSQRNPASPKGA
ncbi:hypothetical protein HMPREF1868_01257 [Olsenella sp. DNF00959]|nr:hypothetical protein HMPREF1868_01257 [Olsenella sp. DNF00959]